MKFLKPALCLLLLQLFSHVLHAQNSVVYSYDSGGNQIQRKILVNVGMRLANPNGTKDSIPSKPLANLKLFPNPTNQNLNLEGRLPDNIKEADVRLMNISGQVLKTDTYQGGSKSLDVSGLNDGLYLLELSFSKKEKVSYKIIITH